MTIRAIAFGSPGTPRERRHEHFYRFDHQAKEWHFFLCRGLAEGARCSATRAPRPAGVSFGRRLLPREEAELEKAGGESSPALPLTGAVAQ